MKYLRSIKKNFSEIQNNIMHHKRRSAFIGNSRVEMFPVYGVRLMTESYGEPQTGFHVIGMLTLGENDIALCAEVTGGKFLCTPFWVNANGRCSPDDMAAQSYNYALNQIYTTDNELNGLFMEGIASYMQRMQNS